MELLSTLTDDFSSSSRDTSKWTLGSMRSAVLAGATASQPAGELRLRRALSTSGLQTYGYVSASTYDATDSSAYVKVVQPLQGLYYTLFFVGVDTSNYVRIQNYSGNLYFYHLQAGTITQVGATLTYSPTAHAWLRVRFSGGSVFFDTAPDNGSGAPGTWTQRATRSVGFAITAVRASLEIGADGDSAGGADVPAIFDGFNTAVGAVPAPSSAARRIVFSTL